MRRLTYILILTFAFLSIAARNLSAADPEASKEAGLKPGPLKVTWDERNIYVDGEIFYVKGVCYSLNYGPNQKFPDKSFKIWEKDFKMITEAGINTIRTYEPMPVKLLDLADKYGLKVIENICYPTGKTNYASRTDLKRLKRTALAYVKRDKNHPAILMWSMWNDMPFKWEEGGSILKRYSRATIESFLKEIYDAIKEQDKNHPVTGANDIRAALGERIGFDYLDVLGFNTFLGISDWLKGKFSLNLAKEQARKIERMASLKHKKPGLILETGYSTHWKTHNQGKVLEAQIKAAGSKVAGVVVFKWADEWEKAEGPSIQDDHIKEYWGIVDIFGNKKSGYSAVSRTFGMIPTQSRGYSGNVRF